MHSANAGVKFRNRLSAHPRPRANAIFETGMREKIDLQWRAKNSVEGIIQISKIQDTGVWIREEVFIASDSRLLRF